MPPETMTDEDEETVVFDNIFNFASQGANIFSVDREGAKSGEGPDENISSSKIHGASPDAKIVREESPEARQLLGFIGALIDATHQAAGAQKAYANDPGSTSNAASSTMKKSSETVKNDPALKKQADDLKDTYKDTELLNHPNKAASPENGDAEPTE